MKKTLISLVLCMLMVAGLVAYAADLVPTTAAGQSLGTSALPWLNGYISNLYVTVMSVSSTKAEGANICTATNGPADMVAAQTNCPTWLMMKSGTNWYAIPGYQVGAP